MNNQIEELVETIRDVTLLRVEDIARVAEVSPDMVGAALRREAAELPMNAHGVEVLDRLCALAAAVVAADIPTRGEDRTAHAACALVEAEAGAGELIPALAHVLGWQSLSSSSGLSLEILLELAGLRFRELRLRAEWPQLRAAAVAGLCADAEGLALQAWDVVAPLRRKMAAPAARVHA